MLKKVNFLSLRSVAKYVPEIEFLGICPHAETVVSSVNQDTIQYFTKLNKLHTLKLLVPYKSSDVIFSAISAMAAANIPLKEMRLYDIEFNSEALVTKFVDAKKNLKQLKTLKLTSSASSSRILQVCTFCSEISTLHLMVDFYFVPSLEFIYVTVQILKRLQSLAIIHKSNRVIALNRFKKFRIDIKAYLKFLEIVQTRGENWKFY